MSKATGPVNGSGRRASHSVALAVILLMMVLMCISEVTSVGAATTGATSSAQTSSTSTTGTNVLGEVAINKQEFEMGVPSYAVLGENYTVKVTIQSKAGIAVPIIVQVSAPVEAMQVEPRLVRIDIQPGASAVATFTILPFAPPHTGPYDLMAQLFVFFPQSMSSPQLVDQATGVVSTIGPNPFPYLEVLLIVGVVVTVVLVAVFYSDVIRKMVYEPSW